MMLLTAEQVSEETGASYALIRSWVEKGWIVPRAQGGKKNKIFLFDEDDVRRISAFHLTRRHLLPESWPMLAEVIRVGCLSRGRQFLAALQERGEELELKLVDDDRGREIIYEPSLQFLVALHSEEKSKDA